MSKFVITKSRWPIGSVIKNIKNMIEMKNEYMKCVDVLHVKFSPTNRKGAPDSVSLIPGHDCPNCKRCLVDCYDVRHDTINNSVARTRAINSAILEADPIRYFDEISWYCKMRSSFRYHVGGDIKNYFYFEQMVRVCRENPHCTFHVFTKNHKVVNEWIANNGGTKEYLPSNLSLRLSEWCGMETNNPYDLNLCSVFQEDEFIEVHDNEAICSGNCTGCFVQTMGCFNKSIKRIYIPRH